MAKADFQFNSVIQLGCSYKSCCELFPSGLIPKNCLTAVIIALILLLATIVTAEITFYYQVNIFAMVLGGIIYTILGYFVIFIPIYSLVGLCFIESVSRNIAWSVIKRNHFKPLKMIFSEFELRHHVELLFRFEKLLESKKDPYVIAAAKAGHYSLDSIEAFHIDYFKS